jgi:hypothetical protein
MATADDKPAFAGEDFDEIDNLMSMVNELDVESF